MGSAVTVTVSDATAPGPRRGPFARWPRSMDAILGVLVIVGTLSILVTAEPEQGVSIDPVADVPWFGYLLVVTAAAMSMSRCSSGMSLMNMRSILIRSTGKPLS